MNKVQAAINSQLEQVITRQKYLEGVNLKLRQSTDDVKHQLLQLQTDPGRYAQLKTVNVADMSLTEFTELVIYKNLESLNKQIKSDSTDRERMNDMLGTAREDKIKLEMIIKQLKKDNENLVSEIKKKSNSLADLRQDNQKLDKMNSLLQERINNYESSNIHHPKVRRDETVDRNLQQHSYQQTSGFPPQTINQILSSCLEIRDQSSQGFSRLTSLTQAVQNRQIELLEKFSHHVRVTKIDEKYKEQYLATIKQLVEEQVRTQTYVSKVVSERDQLMHDINKLNNKLNAASLDLVEEEVNKCKLQDKIKFLEENINKMKLEKKENVDVRQSEVNEDMVKDMKLLLQHREELKEIKNIIISYQDKY